MSVKITLPHYYFKILIMIITITQVHAKYLLVILRDLRVHLLCSFSQFKKNLIPIIISNLKKSDLYFNPNYWESLCL